MIQAFELSAFGIDNLRTVTRPSAAPGPGQVRFRVRALSLNYRDLLVVKGVYNPKLALPATPISDAAGVVADVGAGVTRWKSGDHAVTHFVSGWIDGPFRAEYPKTSLGTPGPGLAAEEVILPAEALVRAPRGYSFVEAATLPIAALTAWSCLATEGNIQPGQRVLTLGTGGVSVFAIQFARTMGAEVLVTSSSDEKLTRAARLGATHGVNYRTQPEWDRAVLERTGGEGVDLVVETGGAGTLDRSLRATRAGGLIALPGALTGTRAEVTTALILMKRLRVQGIYVDSRAAFERMIAFIDERSIRPVIDRSFRFEALPEALGYLESGRHFGKVVLEM
ncbi:MAG: 2-haloacrylate reductase [Phycisphaerae bacterium]|nr:2-haloacrylate reductase [Phycisphaerae bacterium]